MNNRSPKRRAWRLLVPLLPLGLLALAAPHAGAIVRNDPSKIDAYAFQPRIGTPGAFIQVSWSRPGSVPASYILGYQIWRSDLLSPLQVVGGLDTDALRKFTDPELARTITVYNGVPNSDDAGSRTQVMNVPGVFPGVTYQYQVSAAYRNGLQDLDGDRMPDTGVAVMSPFSRISRQVTAIAPPAILSVNGRTPSSGLQVDSQAIALEWQQTPGADSYLIWVSRDPTFRSARAQFNGGQTLAVNRGGSATVSRTISIAKGPLRRARRLFITVGARRSGEPRPRPFGAIFGAPIEVQVETPPPPPPGQ